MNTCAHGTHSMHRCSHFTCISFFIYFLMNSGPQLYILCTKRLVDTYCRWTMIKFDIVIMFTNRKFVSKSDPVGSKRAYASAPLRYIWFSSVVWKFCSKPSNIQSRTLCTITRGARPSGLDLRAFFIFFRIWDI